MSFTDPIADMITRIRNAQLRTLDTVSIPNSKFRARILDVLKEEGYISDYKFLSEAKNKGSLVVNLKYNNGLPVIKEIRRISKPVIPFAANVFTGQKNLYKSRQHTKNSEWTRDSDCIYIYGHHV